MASNSNRSGFLGKTGTDEAPLDRTFYNILNVSPTADGTEIKRAYYTLSLQYHPDRTHNLDEFTRREYAERFKLISQAYSILSDPEKRTLYNRYGKDEYLMNNDAMNMSFEDFNTEEFFRIMFGGEEFHDIIGDFQLAKTFKHTISELLKDGDQTPEQRDEQKRQHLLFTEECIKDQEERVKHLSTNLILKLSVFTDNDRSTNKEDASRQALEHFLEVNRADMLNLLQAPYGEQLLHCIGYIYSFKARFWLSKMNSQEGHIGKRILGYGRHVHSTWKDRVHTVREAVKTVKCAVQLGQSMSKLEQIEHEELAISENADDSQYPFRHHSGHLEYSGYTPSISVQEKPERRSSVRSVVPLSDEAKNQLEANVAAKSMETLWHVVKLEIENTERDVCDRVLNDLSCSRDIRRSRCTALSKLGQLWQQASLTDLS
ncbi:unnamed protein product [Adineta ricciae]|uniref:J domain-containing protein n=1 Tax=Adineta ricciae TaxID=249248 RepID=A0A814SLU9_ADIRI|nr:unnamed protein product [Adineta ricciae]